MATFGENLRALRKSRGYSQDRFAREIGSNQMTLSSWEVGTRMPSLGTMQRIADTFHVPLSSLLPMESTGMEDDFLLGLSDIMKIKPDLRVLFDRAKYLSEEDLRIVISVVCALTKGAV